MPCVKLTFPFCSIRVTVTRTLRRFVPDQAIKESELISAQGLHQIAQTGNWKVLWHTIIKNYPHPVVSKRLSFAAVDQWDKGKQYREVLRVCVPFLKAYSSSCLTKITQTYHPDRGSTESEHWKEICNLITQAVNESKSRN